MRSVRSGALILRTASMGQAFTRGSRDRAVSLQQCGNGLAPVSSRYSVVGGLGDAWSDSGKSGLTFRLMERLVDEPVPPQSV
jgi:hypothetical protein